MSQSLKYRHAWVGFSEKLGIIIYDPDLRCHRFQESRLDEDSVVLWLVNPGRREVFKKSEARMGLKPLWRYLCNPPQSMTEQAARQKASSISGFYTYKRREEDEDDLRDDYDDSFEDTEAEAERSLQDEDMYGAQDDWERDNEEGWFYED